MIQKQCEYIDEQLRKLEREIELLEEAYKYKFPEPSEQLDALNKLNDEYWEWVHKRDLIISRS